MNEKKPIIVFDMDGTLIDSMPLHIKTFVNLTQNFSGGKIKKEIAKNFYLKTAGIKLSSQFKILFKQKKVFFKEKNIKELVKNFFKIKQKNKQKVFNGVKKLLFNLQKNSYILAVSSGCTQKVTLETIQKAGLKKYFKYIWGETTSFSKEEGHFEKLKKLRKKIYFIGDGLADMEIAKKKKIIGIGVATTFPAKKLKQAGAKYVFNGIKNIPLKILN